MAVHKISALEMYRRSYGISQGELAKRSGLNQVTVARYENGEINLKGIRLENLLNIAKTFGVSFDELIHSLDKIEDGLNKIEREMKNEK